METPFRCGHNAANRLHNDLKSEEIVSKEVGKEPEKKEKQNAKRSNGTAHEAASAAAAPMSSTSSRLRGNPAPSTTSHQKAEERRVRRVEYRADIGDAKLAHGLLEQRHSQGDDVSITDIHKESAHEGLFVRAITQGPDAHGLYAGLYTGTELAQKTRRIALELADFHTRQGMPLPTSLFVSSGTSTTLSLPPTQPVARAADESRPVVQIAEGSKANLKGLGVGGQRVRPRPVSTSSTDSLASS